MAVQTYKLFHYYFGGVTPEEIEMEVETKASKAEMFLATLREQAKRDERTRDFIACQKETQFHRYNHLRSSIPHLTAQLYKEGKFELSFEEMSKILKKDCDTETMMFLIPLATNWAEKNLPLWQLKCI